MATGKGPLRIAIEDFLNTFGIGERIREWFRAVFDPPIAALQAAVGPIISDILDAPDLPEKYKKPLRNLTGTEPITLIMVLGAIAMALVVGTVMGIYQPVQKVIAQWVDSAIESARADPSSAWSMTWRTPEHAAELMRHMKQGGWNETILEAWKETVRPRVDPGSLFRHMYRTGASPAEVTAELTRRGYTSDDIAKMQALAQIIPGPSDLVSMAVREAWRDDVAAEWGYDADFPAPFAEWMQKQGDVDNWAQKYWRAHWTLPGLSTVLDILYRVPEFTKEDLDTYLRISDIPATWRNYVSRTAYRPLTRVDVRRMYGMGVLDRDAVKRSYLDLGYDETNAEHMTEFTVRFETEEDRAATKTDILSFYKVGALTADEAVDWLQAIGYPADLAAYLITREQMKVEQARQDQQTKHIRNLYIHGEITVTDASSRLASIGVPAGEITQLLDEWQIARDAKVERPSRATLDKLFRQDVIAEAEYTDGLDALGYQPRYVGWYLSSILQIKTEEARKEEERARTEQEDIRKRRIKSDYQVAKAALDVDIAEVATAISETQLALRARQLRYQDESRLAREVVSVAELREVAAVEVASLESQIGDQEEAIAFLDEQVDALQTLIAEVKLRAALEVPTITAEAAVVQIKEGQLGIEIAQDDIAGARVTIAELRSQIHARQTRLAVDVRVAARILSVEEIEVDWRADLASMTGRISELRVNLAELREQKSRLAVQYRVGIAEE